MIDDFSFTVRTVKADQSNLTGNTKVKGTNIIGGLNGWKNLAKNPKDAGEVGV